MTLKQFALQHGINYRTAQTWARRGRIQQTDSGFAFVGVANPESLPQDSTRDSMRKTVTDSLSARDAVNDLLDRVESLERHVAELRARLEDRPAPYQSLSRRFCRYGPAMGERFDDGEGPEWGA